MPRPPCDTRGLPLVGEETRGILQEKKLRQFRPIPNDRVFILGYNVCVVVTLVGSGGHLSGAGAQPGEQPTTSCSAQSLRD